MNLIQLRLNLSHKADSKENFIRVYQQMLKDEDMQTELVDLIAEEQRKLDDALGFVNLEFANGETRKKK